MVDIDTISIVIAASSVVLGVYNSIRASRRADEQRQLQLFMQIYGKVYDPSLRRPLINVVRCWQWDDWDDFMNKYGPNTNPNDYCDFNALLGYYEGIGVLVKKGFIDIQLVYDLMGGDVIHLYKTIEQIIIERRKEDGMEKAYEGIEDLYKKIMALEKQ